MNATAADLASGKGHKDENFPVASKLVAPQYRALLSYIGTYAADRQEAADEE